MDDIFGQLTPLDLPVPDICPDFNLDIDLNPKDMMDLEEFDFDFEEINDFGPWIATSSSEDNNVEVINEEENNRFLTSDRLNFEDLEIKEAVRYDCMWASYNEFNGSSKSRISSNTSNLPSSDPSLNITSSFYDSLLNSIDTPDNSNSDSSSIKSEMETDEDEQNSEHKNNVMQNEDTKVVKMNPAHLITSLDHCYNISSTHLDNERFLPKSGPLTPPVSSDDEDSSNQTNFTIFSNSFSSHHHNRNKNTSTKHRRIMTTNKTHNTQSLLKKPQHRQRTTSEAKFSINLKVNLTNTSKTRSLLKQKVKIVRTPPFLNKASTSTPSIESQLKKKLFEQHRTSQSAMRKRKERSLKMQEGEAREVHNQMERQRRNELKLAYDVLKVHLPEIASSEKASKQQILDKAVETCQSMRLTESSLKTKVTTLNKTNSLLREKLRKLQAAHEKRKASFHLGIEDW